MKIGDFDNNPTSEATTLTANRFAMPIGSAIGLERTERLPRRPDSSIGDSFKFYFSEYFGGILFITAVLLFILIARENVKHPLKVVMAMIDRFLKKALDILGAAIGLILCIPFFLIIPLLIKLDSPGPIFYTQDRVGLNRRKKNRRSYKAVIDGDSRVRDRRRQDYHGQPFKVIKFRTMVQDAERHCGPVWATKNDPRITRLGRFLRKTRLDEIPQLINVIKGDMSMVGPRPERPTFVSDFAEKIPEYRVRLNVKPGITGLAQVSSGYDSSLQSVIIKLKADINYIRDWSIWSDIKILMRTVVVVLTGKGAC
jgi:lipopolysaccharide/colanic/teichoic acid biosynthesis glycosyltransferase